MKKHVRRDNRRRKKTNTERKAARARAHSGRGALDRLDDEWNRRNNPEERRFLLGTLHSIGGAVAAVIRPHLPALLGEDYDDDDDIAEDIAFALDLIADNMDVAEPYAAVIRDVWRDGAEAALPHLARAIQWHLDFHAQRAGHSIRDG
jgi:hypothetical protein